MEILSRYFRRRVLTLIGANMNDIKRSTKAEIRHYLFFDEDMETVEVVEFLERFNHVLKIIFEREVFQLYIFGNKTDK